MKPKEVTMSHESTSNTKAVLDYNNIPIEELLGSVTTYNNVEGSESRSQQLRTSARVFKKMKLDSAVVITSPVALDTSNKKEPVKEETKEVVKKGLRPSWSQEDKNLFFEALNEYGKDFEAIHSHINNKLRKKGLPDSVMKTKDQVRHFYYRTWHKISKHLKFSDDIKKIVQELYGLINYGELRRKVGSVSEKMCMKLNELIYRGSVAMRTKGKTVRIKTPMCRALRKLNELDEKHDDLKLPTRVNVEIIPRNMETWLKVQGISQNPRVKAFLPLQKRLSALIKFLNCKWKSISESVYENTLCLSNAITSECLPEEKVLEENKSKLDPLLRLRPPPKVNIEIPSLNLSEYFTSQSICLNALEERIGVKTPGELLWVTKGTTRKGGTKRSRYESNSEKSLPNNQKVLVTIPNRDNNENCINGSDAPLNVEEVVDAAVSTLLALQNQILSNNDEEKKAEEVQTEVCEDLKAIEKKQENISLIRDGWTCENSGTITIGELYLMFGSNSNLILEYSWDEPETLSSKPEARNCDVMNDDLASTSFDDSASVTCLDDEEKHTDKSDLKSTLEKLLSIAKLHYRKNIVHCPCGHVCGNGKNNNQNKAKSVPKVCKVGEKSTDNVDKPVLEPNKTDTKIVSSPSVVPIIIQTPASVFRQPVSPNMASFRATLDSFHRLQPRYCNRRGRRPRTKQVVVERKLSLLPNTTENRHQIVQMNIVSQDDIRTGPRTIAPKILNIDNTTEHNIVPANNIPLNTVNVSEIANTFGSETMVASTTMTTSTAIDITDNAVTPSRVGSPTSISNFLEFALNSHGEILEDQNKGEAGISSFVGLLSNNLTSATPPSSPSRILKENENHWLNSEVADFSLSSFLGHLESPIKGAHSSTSIAPEDNHLPQEVDAHLESLLVESSVDYMAKFADLAAKVDVDVKK